MTQILGLRKRIFERFHFQQFDIRMIIIHPFPFFSPTELKLYNLITEYKLSHLIIFSTIIYCKSLRVGLKFYPHNNPLLFGTLSDATNTGAGCAYLLRDGADEEGRG